MLPRLCFVFFLDFVYNHKKTAYAPSMGPCPDETISPELYGFIENALNSYCEISAREAGTADFVERITGKRPKICIDPTLLLEEEEWRLLAGSKPIISEDYMLFYSPFPTKEQCSELLLLSKRTGLKVILTTPNGTFRLIHKRVSNIISTLGRLNSSTLSDMHNLLLAVHFMQ